MSRRCLVAYLARSIDARCTQPDWDAGFEQFSLLFCSFFGCFLTKEEQRSARNCTRSWNWSVTRRSNAELEQHSTPLQVTSVYLRGNLPNICLLKQRLNCRPASRHCQETLSKCSWHEPRAARRTHTLSLFCFCVLVTYKMSYVVNKSCITQHVVAQGGYASEVVRNSQNTAWHGRKSSAFFLFNQPRTGALHASFESPETWTWWPHLANFRLDVLIVVLSGSDSDGSHYFWSCHFLDKNDPKTF